MAYIYMIENKINNKVYIGKTEHSDPYKRWKEHIKDHVRQRCEKRPLYSAMKKYGTENFEFKVLEETDIPEEREIYYINKYRTYVGFKDCNGYNATLGGDGKKYLNLNEDDVVNYHINEAIYQLNETAKYFKVDKITIKKILEKRNISWISSKIRNIMKSYLKCGLIAQIDKDNNDILNIFLTLPEANRFIGVKPDSNNIRHVLLGKNSTAYGYKWVYAKDIPDEIWNPYIQNTLKICKSI